MPALHWPAMQLHTVCSSRCAERNKRPPCPTHAAGSFRPNSANQPDRVPRPLRQQLPVVAVSIAPVGNPGENQLCSLSSFCSSFAFKSDSPAAVRRTPFAHVDNGSNRRHDNSTRTARMLPLRSRLCQTLATRKQIHQQDTDAKRSNILRQNLRNDPVQNELAIASRPGASAFDNPLPVCSRCSENAIFAMFVKLHCINQKFALACNSNGLVRDSFKIEPGDEFGETCLRSCFPSSVSCIFGHCRQAVKSMRHFGIRSGQEKMPRPRQGG